MEEALKIGLHTTVAYLFLLLVTRIMGRKEVSQLTFFDYITGITIGSIVANVAMDPEENLSAGILSAAIWTAWVMITNHITLVSVPARKLIDGEPIVVIHQGKILEKNLGKRSYNVNDVLMQLRSKSIFDPNEVELGIIEANGDLSILKKSQFQNVTLQDLNITPKPQPGSDKLSRELVIDGKINWDNLALSGLNEQALMQHLKAQGVNRLDEVMLVSILPDNTLYVDKRVDNAESQFIEKGKSIG